MKEFLIHVRDEAATTVRNLIELIPAIEIVSETNCVESVGAGNGKEDVEDNPTANTIDSRQMTSEQLFVEKCKEVARKISELNGEKLTYTPKGKVMEYIFQFDAEGFCTLMDVLYDSCYDIIDDYLAGVQSPTGISIVLPFVGKILGDYIFSSQQSLHKSSLKLKLMEIYDSNSIEKYLSFDGRKRKDKLNELFDEAVKIASKEGLSQLSR